MSHFVIIVLAIVVVILVVSLLMAFKTYNPSFGELIVNVDDPTEDDIFKLVIKDDINTLATRNRVVLRVVKR